MKFKGRYPIYRNKIHYREMQKNRTLDEFDKLDKFDEDDNDMEREEE